MNKHCLCAILLAIGLLGCKEEPAGLPAQPSGPAPTPPAVQPERPAFKPEFKVTIQPNSANPPRYIVKWTAGVNTGGWKLTVDQSSVEDQHRELRVASVYATLEEPGPSEVVTQAMETLSGEYDAGTQKVDKADLHVRRKVRGQKTDFAPLYGRVATVGKQN